MQTPIDEASDPQHIECFSPATGERLGSVPVVGPKCVAEIVANARAAQHTWGNTDFATRRRVLQRILDHVLDHADELCELLVTDAGKTFEHATPLGPGLVTRDEVGDGSGLELRTEVDGVLKQQGSTDQMVFSVIDIIRDLSTILTLDPGDVIATGTPEGVGDARDPQEYLTAGAVVQVTIEGVGRIRNRCVPDSEVP